jgi:chromosome segregation ATPase
MKDLLSASIDILVWDSDKVKHLFVEIKPQLPEVLQIKLWLAGHLPFFRAKVEKAHRSIEARHSQASLKADIAKTDTSASTQRLELLGRELEDLKERVRSTEQLIQDEKNLIASSKQEVEDLTTQLKTELP